ncbi:hypothetical protein D3C79_645880 [compost metagenome]
MGLALDGHAGLVVGQVVGRELITTVGTPGNHRLVGVTVDVLDDHVLADARDRHRAPAATGPALRHTHPAGAELVVLAFTVPGKADLHPAPLIAIDLFSLRADHGSHVRAINAWF